MKKIFLCLFCLMLSLNVFAAAINNVVFFGDSLSDDGNLYAIMKIIPQSPPYYQGRFSNGPTWAEYVGKYYYDKTFADFSNYAYGGATAILHELRYDHFIAPALLQEEIDGYLARSSADDKSKTLYAIWIGANDYLYDFQPDIDALTGAVVDKISSSITSLIQKGGHHFLVLNLPDLSRTPFATENNNVERLKNISVLHNSKLSAAITALKNRYPTFQFVTIDVFSIFNDLLNDPEKYNEQFHTHITDTTHNCWSGDWWGFDFSNQLEIDLSKKLQTKTVSILGKTFNQEQLTNAIIHSPSLTTAYAVGKMYEQGGDVCSNPDEHVFWDVLHPTSVIHKGLSEIVIDTLEASSLL